MKNILFNNLKEIVFGSPVSKLFEMEPGISVENIYSQYLSQGGFKLVQIRSQLQSGVECGGLGVDRDPRIALIKALSEYFERKAVLVADELLGFNSTNGVASHRFSLLAKHAAYFELAERDAFLAHWYSRSPFEKVDDIPSRLIGILRSFDANNLKALFFVTNLGFEKATVCFIVDKTSGGFAECYRPGDRRRRGYRGRSA
jgi:ribosomal protein S12 methylthiotransferase accessory factor YcaO